MFGAVQDQLVDVVEDDTDETTCDLTSLQCCL